MRIICHEINDIRPRRSAGGSADRADIFRPYAPLLVAMAWSRRSGSLGSRICVHTARLHAARAMRYVGRSACTLAVVLSTASPVVAQARVWEGGVMPVTFDAHGARHYYTYGYYGPLVPSIESQRKAGEQKFKD